MKNLKIELLEKLAERLLKEKEGPLKGLLDVAGMIVEKAIESEEWVLEDGDNDNDYSPIFLSFSYFKKMALNGAKSFAEASYNGNYLVYNESLCEFFLPRSEFLGRVKNNDYSCPFDGYKDWLDYQSMMLKEACFLLPEIAEKMLKEAF